MNINTAGTADATGCTTVNYYPPVVYPYPYYPNFEPPRRSSSCPYCTPRCPHGFIADPVRPQITWQLDEYTIGGFMNPSTSSITLTMKGETE